MGKSSPKAPQAPDPVATAQAQGAMNRETAIANANLNRINQYTPQGSLVFNQIGTNADGTPRYESRQTYSPEQQRLYEQQMAVSNALSGLAGDNITRVAQAQAKPFTYEGMTPIQTSINAGGIQSGYASGGPVRQAYDAGGNIQRQVANAGAINTGYGSGGDIQRQVANAGNINTGYGSGGDIQRQIASAGDVTRGYASGGDIQRQVADAGAVARDYASGGNIQRGLDFSGLSGLPGINDFGAEARRVQDAVYQQATSRLDPQWQQQERQLAAQLAAKGVSENSEAYRRAFDQMARQRTDAYNQATFSGIQAGGQEQSRLFGLALSGRQQGAAETQAAGSFANQAQAQAEAQAAARAGFGNAAQQQQYAQNMQSAQFGNTAQAQAEAQAAARAGFANEAQAQQYGQNANNAQFANTAQAQAEAQAAARAQFGNVAQQQQYGQNLQSAQFGNTAQAQAEAQAAARAQFGNEAQQQLFGQNLQGGAFANAAQQQQNQQNLDAANFGNAAQQQQTAQNAALAAFGNQAQQQGFGQAQANAAFNNQARQQQIQEAAYLRNMPLNDIAALLGTGGGVQNPAFADYANVNVAPVDYSGLVQNNFSNQMQLYQQQQAARNAGLGSIFGLAGNLGAAALMGSDRRLKHGIKAIGELANGIKAYTFSYIGSAVRYFGCMADEVATVCPESVVTTPEGYGMVDYGKVWNYAR